MNSPRPYYRAFVVGTVWFGAVAYRMAIRTGLNEFMVITMMVAWCVTALLVGFIATKLPRLRSWWGIGLATVCGCFLTLQVMLALSPQQPKLPTFKTTDEFMAYAANNATKWVKDDRQIELDYSPASVAHIEAALDRLSKQIPRDKPPAGTFGQAIAYGAYVGEVLRRKHGGIWAADHPEGGEHSYPLAIKSNLVVFPVLWCWKRAINGEEDNVLHKVQLLETTGDLELLLTNRADKLNPTNQSLLEPAK